MQLRRTLPLEPPRPFRVASCEATTRAQLVDSLTLVHRALDEPRADVAASIQAVLWPIIQATEHDARDIAAPFVDALGVGAAMATVETARNGRHKLTRNTWSALGWAAVDLASSVTPRVAPWVDYGVRAGYYVVRESTTGLAKAQSELEQWAREQLRGTTYMASLDGYLVGEFVVSDDRRVGGRKYLPLRPSGAEREYDELVFELAWDDLLESLSAPRLRGTPAEPALVQFDWTPALPVPVVVAEPVVVAPPVAVAPPVPAPRVYAPPVLTEVAAMPQPAEVWAPVPQPVAAQPVPQVPVAAASAVQAAPDAGWYTDGTGRHLLRWWDGSTWTHWVSSGEAPFDERTATRVAAGATVTPAATATAPAPAAVAVAVPTPAATPARTIDTQVRRATATDERLVVDLRLDDLGIDWRPSPSGLLADRSARPENAFWGQCVGLRPTHCPQNRECPLAVDRPDVRLALVGPDPEAVTDDVEAAAEYQRCRRHWEALPPAVRRRIQLVRLPMVDGAENAAMVNALQRHAAVVVQKSLAEGFGLTATEAMWKGRAVVAANVGGLVDQVVEGCGVLVDPRDLDACAVAIAGLLDDAPRREQLGDRAAQRVRAHFLPDAHLIRWANLIESLIPPETEEHHMKPKPLSERIDALAERLSGELEDAEGQAADPEHVSAVVHERAAQLDDAPIQDFADLLIEHHARADLHGEGLHRHLPDDPDGPVHDPDVGEEPSGPPLLA